jgi:ribosomal protein S18 acetylase RimI-like enzyme
MSFPVRKICKRFRRTVIFTTPFCPGAIRGFLRNKFAENIFTQADGGLRFFGFYVNLHNSFTSIFFTMTTDNRNFTITFCDYSRAEHRQAVATLINVYIKDEMGEGEPLSGSGQLRLVEGLAQHPAAIVLLAETCGLYAGLLVAFENFSTFTARPMVNIHDVIVLPEYRGKGAGRMLMNGLISEATRRGASRVTLEVRNDNPAAQHLYRSLGFGETSPGMYYWRKYIQ